MSDNSAKAAAPKSTVEEIRPLNVHPNAVMTTAQKRRYLLQHETAPLMREVDEDEYRALTSGDNGHFWRIAKWWVVE